MRQLVDEIFAEGPRVHQGETETDRPLNPAESLLAPAELARLARREPVCWGIAKEAGLYLYDTVQPGWATLETGAGLTTLVFALRKARHTAVTPSASEATGIKKYARTKRIAMRGVRFVVAASEDYLPRARPTPLDLVLIDGKHAFPWPVLDWFYTAERLRQGGLMMVDDCALPGVAQLTDFLRADARWALRKDLGGKTLVFEKTAPSVRDVAWHMQWVKRS